METSILIVYGEKTKSADNHCVCRAPPCQVDDMECTKLYESEKESNPEALSNDEDLKFLDDSKQPVSKTIDNIIELSEPSYHPEHTPTPTKTMDRVQTPNSVKPSSSRRRTNAELSAEEAKEIIGNIPETRSKTSPARS